MSRMSSISAAPASSHVDTAELDRDVHERVKLLKFVGIFGVGGTEQQVVTLARELDHSRFELHLACFGRRGELRDQLRPFEGSTAEYRIRKLYNKGAVQEWMRLARYIRGHQIQIVHTYNFHPTVFAVPAARLAGARVVIASVRDMGAYLTPAQQRVQRMVGRLAHRVVANSEAVRQWLIREGWDGCRISVIRNGIDLSRFQPQVGHPGLRRELGLPPGVPIVAVISRLSRVKGLDDFLEAAAMLAATRPDVHFLLVGESSGTERGYEHQIAAQAARLGLERRVVFAGLRLDVPALLSEVAVSVLPSLSEGLSNVLLESMATGVPMVATCVGGNAEAVEDGVTGLLVPPRQPSALAAAIGRLLDDQALAARLVQAGRRRVVEDFSMQAVARTTERLYLTLLEGSRHAI